ncbi:MAG: rhamnogalacturonan acetylesterase [Acidobacteriaceae bacterium]
MARFSSIRNLFLFASTFLAPLAFAQSTAPPPTPIQHNLPTDQPLNTHLPTVFVVGDSTARNNANLGWGDHFAHLFDTSRINVANRAIAGRSSRTYITEGHWTQTLAEINPGDYVLFQLGHNDGGDLAGPKPRGSIKGIGDETQQLPQTAGPFAGKVETVHTYGWYLRKMIDETRAKGAFPILLTLTVRNIWKACPDGTRNSAGGPNCIERDMGYTTYLNQLATQEKVPLIDMSDIAANRFEALGESKTAELFPKDHTHTSPEGAELNAESVAKALRKAHSPIAAYLKPQH